MTLLRKHGHNTRAKGRSPTYHSWINLRQRCLNPENARYADYGGRGITVDPRWNKFENFLEDMGERPTGTSIERRDNDLGYTKDNCFWGDVYHQAHNRRDRIDNSSGYTGVYYVPRMDRYWAYVNRFNKRVSLGYHKTPEEAAKRRQEWLASNSL